MKRMPSSERKKLLLKIRIEAKENNKIIQMQQI